MIPISELNDVRRRVVEQLETLRLKKFSRQKISATPATKILVPSSQFLVPKITAHVDTLEKLKVALDAGADEILFGGETFKAIRNVELGIRNGIELVHKRGKKISWSTPRIVRENENFILPADVDAIYVHNLATLKLANFL